MHAPVAVAGLAGGLSWIAAYVVDATVGGGLVDALAWAGVALLAIAVLGAGASLVSRSATWLRVVVAVCFALLVGSVLELVRGAGDPLAVDALAGLLAGAVAAVVLARGRAEEDAAGAGRAGPRRAARAVGAGRHAR